MSRHLNILVLLIGFARVAMAHPLDNWHLQTNGIGFKAVAYGNGLFVGVGVFGTNVTSPDGSVWSAHPVTMNGYPQAIAFGNGQFVAVGTAGLIMSSPDGTNWAIQASGTSSTIWRVAYGNGLFIANMVNGFLLTSTDGTHWSIRPAPDEGRPYYLTFGNGLFLLEQFYPTFTNFVSSDGITWLPRPPATDMGLSQSQFGAIVFMSTGLGDGVFTSPDGSNWVSRGQFTSARPGKPVFGGGYYILSGLDKAEYSSNGESWTSISNLGGFSNREYVFTYGNGFFVTCDGQGIKKSDPIVTLQMDGPSSLRFLGPTGAVVNVESSSLAPGELWQPVTNLLLPTNPYLWTAPAPSNAPQRFYRATLVP